MEKKIRMENRRKKLGLSVTLCFALFIIFFSFPRATPIEIIAEVISGGLKKDFDI